MAIRKQLSIFLSNHPGSIARVGEAMKENEINIVGLTVSDTVDHAVLRLIVDKPEKATAMFEERNILVLEGELLEARLPNTPGGFAAFAAKLAEEKLNINYAYGSISNGDGNDGVLFIHVNETEKAEEILQKFLAG